MNYSFIVNNINLPIDASYQEAFSVALNRLSKIGIKSTANNCKIYKKSIDARKKDNIKFVYSVSINTDEPPKISIERLKLNGISLCKNLTSIDINPGLEKLSAPPVIVGSGPCGLFAALMLAEYGFNPVVIERGSDVKNRTNEINDFIGKRVLNPETNIQFGAGGAGTFSDGKLITRINDPLSNYVLTKFVEHGAPKDILYQAKPHIGTDILSVVIQKIIDQIIHLGGQVLFNTKFEGFVSNLGKITSVNTSRGTIPAGAIVLAIGHSARDTYEKLMSDGMSFEAKSFSVGMRIEHLSEDIDRALYGNYAGHKQLGRAEYNLSFNTKERGVYTFCMCPGGVVIAAASEENGVVTNGMSYHARDGKNSNSAVCCSIFKSDYGFTPKDAIEFQRNIERNAYSAAGNNYCAPMITVGDLLDDELKHEPNRILPTYMNGQGVRLVAPQNYLPNFVVDSLKRAIVAFDKNISGFAVRDAILTGPETRTSSPVRIIRDNITRIACGYSNLYPAGEGAGYAGGITSSAIDGLKTAIEIIKRYKS